LKNSKGKLQFIDALVSDTEATGSLGGRLPASWAFTIPVNHDATSPERQRGDNYYK